MFLDDELYHICEQYGEITPDNIQALNKTLCEKCDTYYKSKLEKENIRKLAEIKSILDRTFNLWNSFVIKLSKSENRNLNICSTIFKKYTFKFQFLSNPETNQLYNKL